MAMLSGDDGLECGYKLRNNLGNSIEQHEESLQTYPQLDA